MPFIIQFWQLVSIADFEQTIKELVKFNYRPPLRCDVGTTVSLALSVLSHGYYL